jgi:hypothetical protein
MTAAIVARRIIWALSVLSDRLEPDPLPAQPPITGPLWSVAVPALLFVVSLWATVLLYRHFAGRGRNGRSSTR